MRCINLVRVLKCSELPSWAWKNWVYCSSFFTFSICITDISQFVSENEGCSFVCGKYYVMNITLIVFSLYFLKYTVLHWLQLFLNYYYALCHDGHRSILKQEKFSPRCTPRNSGPQSRDTPPKRGSLSLM